MRQKPLLCLIGFIDYGGGGSSHLEVWNSKRKIGIRIPGDKRSGEENENENQTKPKKNHNW